MYFLWIKTSVSKIIEIYLHVMNEQLELVWLEIWWDPCLHKIDIPLYL